MKWFILTVVLLIVPEIWLFIKIKKSNYNDGLPDIEDICTGQSDTGDCMCEDCKNLNNGKDSWV